jgi:DNA processing protein
MGGVTDDVVLARALLSRVGEPASIPLWAAVRARGPVETAAAIRAGKVDDYISRLVVERAAEADPHRDLDAARRHGVRLVVPESAEWPHFALASLESAGRRRLARWHQGERAQADRGELIPPLALWVRGEGDLSTVGVRSAALVGARAATDYGRRVTADLAAALAGRGFVVISGGAYGIDAAAHRAALAVGGDSVLVSAGGLDRAYPPAHTALFDQVAASGLVLSESPPGAAPQRRRFLTRNRLIAALGTGSIVVEAARRSGALNTASHCLGLGRPLMAVPGPVDSAMSAGCHQLLTADTDPRALLVTGIDDVLSVIGSASDLPPRPEAPAGRDPLAARLDAVDPVARRVFDGFPARGWVGPQNLSATTNLSPVTILRTLPMLELAGLVESSPEGFRIVRAPPRDRRIDPPASGDSNRQNAQLTAEQ